MPGAPAVGYEPIPVPEHGGGCQPPRAVQTGATVPKSHACEPDNHPTATIPFVCLGHANVAFTIYASFADFLAATADRMSLVAFYFTTAAGLT